MQVCTDKAVKYFK